MIQLRSNHNLVNSVIKYTLRQIKCWLLTTDVVLRECGLSLLAWDPITKICFVQIQLIFSVFWNVGRVGLDHQRRRAACHLHSGENKWQKLTAARKDRKELGPRLNLEARHTKYLLFLNRTRDGKQNSQSADVTDTTTAARNSVKGTSSRLKRR